MREVILPLYSGKTSLKVLCPALRPLTQERHGPTAVGPEEGHKGEQIAGPLLLCRWAEKNGAVQCGVKKAPGRLYSYISLSEGDLQKDWGRTV